MVDSKESIKIKDYKIMGKNITLFSGYHQSENRNTNYCLLILKLLYEENPKYFAQFLSNVGGDYFSENVGVKFLQQGRKISSIPDGIIQQNSFCIYLEVKNYDWFYDDQLERHIDSLSEESSQEKILLAISNFQNDNYKDNFNSIKELCRFKYKNQIKFEVISFEEFISALESLSELSIDFRDTILELKDYLDEQNLLPTWKNWLDVINCAGIPEEVLEGNVYMCPATGGSYNHTRCKYFGMYRNKKVEKIGLIEAVVDIESKEDLQLKWKNIDGSDEIFLQRANNIFNQLRPNEFPTRVFLLGKLYDTTFEKATKGGMQSSKQYFDISNLNCLDAEDLAKKLNNKSWSKY